MTKGIAKQSQVTHWEVQTDGRIQKDRERQEAMRLRDLADQKLDARKAKLAALLAAEEQL